MLVSSSYLVRLHMAMMMSLPIFTLPVDGFYSPCSHPLAVLVPDVGHGGYILAHTSHSLILLLPVHWGGTMPLLIVHQFGSRLPLHVFT